jgi:hypothetical protein
LVDLVPPWKTPRSLSWHAHECAQQRGWGVSFRRVAMIALMLAALWPCAHARALELTWTAPPGCPDTGSMRTRIERALTDPGALLAVRGVIRELPDRFALTLEVEREGQRFTRRLHARDCEALATSAAFLIALGSTPGEDPVPDEASGAPAVERTAAPSERAHDDDAHERALEDAARAPNKAASRDSEAPSPTPTANEQTTQVVAPAPVERAPAQRPTAAPEPRPGARMTIEQTRVAAYVGALPLGLAGVMPAVGLELGVAGRVWSLGLRAGWLARRKREVGTGQVSFVGEELLLEPCREWPLGTLRLAACLPVGALFVQARGRSLVSASARQRVWATGGLAAVLRWSLGSFAELGLAAGGLLPLSTRPSFEVRGFGTVGQVRPLTGFVRLLVGARFE